MSKEEIEKAKETCNSIVNFCNNNKECQENEFCPDCYIEIEDVKAIETLLQYIDQLEKENNKQNKIIEEIAKTWKQDDYRSIEELKQYFENKVEEK